MYEEHISEEQVKHYYDVNADNSQKRYLIEEDQELIEFHENALIRIWFNDLAANFETHWHTTLEVIMPIENWYDITIGEQSYHVVPGEILFVPPCQSHSIEAPSTGNRFVFLFDLDIISKLHSYSSITSILERPIYMNQEQHSDVFEILKQMKDIYFAQLDFSELSIYSLLLNLFVRLANYHLDNIPMLNELKEGKQREYVQRFNDVMEYIDSHYMLDLNLDTVASAAGFSKYHFSRLFKQYTNYTFCNYICHRRILEASKLLEQPELSITKVAMQSGFSSIPTFNRAFKREKNCTPSEYRNLNHRF